MDWGRSGCIDLSSSPGTELASQVSYSWHETVLSISTVRNEGHCRCTPDRALAGCRRFGLPYGFPQGPRCAPSGALYRSCVLCAGVEMSESSEFWDRRNLINRRGESGDSLSLDGERTRALQAYESAFEAMNSMAARETGNLQWKAGALYIASKIGEDRKSTRLNSSHLVISYAVFCLKKKKKKNKIKQTGE